MTSEPAKGGLSDDDISRLEKLASMRDRGILTQQEFEEQKAIIRGLPEKLEQPLVNEVDVPIEKPARPPEWEAWEGWGKGPTTDNQGSFDELDKKIASVENNVGKPTPAPTSDPTWGGWNENAIAGRGHLHNLELKLPADPQTEKTGAAPVAKAEVSALQSLATVALVLILALIAIWGCFGLFAAPQEQAAPEAARTTPSAAPGWIKAEGTGCNLWNPAPEPNETVTWSGACVNGMASGKGVEQWYSNGAIGNQITGFAEDGRQLGTVEVLYPSGHTYVGTLRSKDGKQWVGTLYSPDGSKRWDINNNP